MAFPKTMAGVGHLNRICEDAFSVAGAIQETSSSELLGGPGADFLREVVSVAWNFPFLKEVSQNCFVFDVVNFEKRGSLAELLRF